MFEKGVPVNVLLLTAPNPFRRQHLQRVREGGHRLVLMGRDAAEHAEPVDLVAEVDISAVEEVVARARELHRQTGGFDAVLTFVEHGVTAAAAVAADLGLSSVSPAAAYLSRDKYAMHLVLTEGSVRMPATVLVGSVPAALQAAETLGYPVVLKPVIGSDSTCVLRVDGERQLAAEFDRLRAVAWENYQFDSLHGVVRENYGEQLLIQEYIPGREVSVESLVVNGVTHCVAVHDKPLPMEGPDFSEVYFATPSGLPVGVQEQLSEVTAAANKLLGVDTGVTHTEFRITDQHEVVLLESAARIGGGGIQSSVRHSTGVDLVGAMVDLVSGVTPVLEPRPVPRPTGWFILFADRSGVLTGVRGVEALRADPRVLDLELYCQVGSRIELSEQVSSAWLGRVVFTAGTRAELDATFHELWDTVEFVIED